jgi:uroporphyrinogen III methyltransferase / synthase
MNGESRIGESKIDARNGSGIKGAARAEGVHRPLYGKSVVVTRSAEQSRELIDALGSQGAEVLSLPLLRFEDPEDTLLLDASLRALDRIDWIIFTSANAVRFTAKRAAALQMDAAKQHGRMKIAAVGAVTATAAQNEGLWADYVAKNQKGSGLAAELENEIRGKRVLLPRSNIANNDLPAALRQSAGQVIEVVAYRTISGVSPSATAGGRIRGDEPPPSAEAAVMERICANDVDAIIFASPSAFHNFAELAGAETLRKLSESKRLASIGPTTSQAIRDAGWKAAIEAREPSAEGIASALVQFFSAGSAVHAGQSAGKPEGKLDTSEVNPR